MCVQAVGKQESLCSNEFPSFDGVLVDAEGDAHITMDVKGNE